MFQFFNTLLRNYLRILLNFFKPFCYCVFEFVVFKAILVYKKNIPNAFFVIITSAMNNNERGFENKQWDV